MNYHSGCSPSAQPIGPSTYRCRRAERDYPPHVGPQQALALQPQTCSCGLIIPEPPSTLLLVPSIPSVGVDPRLRHVTQVIFQDQRNISEMRFKLPAGLNDGISFPHHQIQTPGSFALMPENRLHFILLLTIDHYGRRRSSPPFRTPWTSGTFSGFDTWKTGWISQAGGRSNPYAIGEITLATQ